MTDEQVMILDMLMQQEEENNDSSQLLVKPNEEESNDGLLIEGLITKANGDSLSWGELIDVFEANGLEFGGSTTPYIDS